MQGSRLTAELSEDEIANKMKEIFPTKEAFKKSQDILLKELFPDDSKKDN